MPHLSDDNHRTILCGSAPLLLFYFLLCSFVYWELILKFVDSYEVVSIIIFVLNYYILTLCND